MRGAIAMTIFNLMHPVRGANGRAWNITLERQYFNLTHPMRGAIFCRERGEGIAIYFNLMHPMRGATAKLYNQNMP